MNAPENCPICGADLAKDAKVCPECGADEKFGWSEESQTDHLDLPDENFNYDDFVKREFGKQPVPHGIHWLWWLTAIVLVIVFVWFALH